MLCAWLATDIPLYKDIARASFDFLLKKTFRKNRIRVISNKDLLPMGKEPVSTTIGGEQPIDVAYPVMALSKFYNVFRHEDYL